jgi:hypothetical protein
VTKTELRRRRLDEKAGKAKDEQDSSYKSNDEDNLVFGSIQA